MAETKIYLRTFYPQSFSKCNLPAAILFKKDYMRTKWLIEYDETELVYINIVYAS